MISEVFLREKLTKSLCGMSKTRPEAVSTWNGLLCSIRSSSSELSMTKAVISPFRHCKGFFQHTWGVWGICSLNSSRKTLTLMKASLHASGFVHLVINLAAPAEIEISK